MADEEESKKRRGVMSPGAEPEDKQQRNNSPPCKSKPDDLHPSILTSRDMMTTPINVLSHPFVIANSRLQNLRSPVSIEIPLHYGHETRLLCKQAGEGNFGG